MIKKLLLSCFAIFGLSFFLSFSDTYALQDRSFTYDAEHTAAGVYLCNSDSDVSCSGYKYLYITNDDPTVLDGLSSATYFSFAIGTSNLSFYPFYSNFALYDISSNVNSVYVNSRSSSGTFLSSGGSVTFLLSENPPFTSTPPSASLSITENGTYDVTNYSSAVVDVPQTLEGDGSFIVNLFKGGFWNVATAIVGLIVPVLALFLVFRLIHGLIYGKGV